MSREVANTENILDSRDVIARLEELKDERLDLVTELADATEKLNESDEDDAEREELEEAVTSAREAIQEWDDDNGEELRILTALNDEGENATSEWVHGETMIRESYFTEYAEELCKDIGDLPKDIPGYLVIDWEATAKNLLHDYTEVDFDGETYYVRSN